MSRKRKYQIISGYMVYAHILPNKMTYFGMSKRQPCFRWHPLQYKTTALVPYIERYGWENIEHKVLIDGLTEQQARLVEDWFVRKATADGFCINERRSGGLAKNDKKMYMKQYNEERKQYYKEYNKDHKEEKKEYNKQYHKKQNSTPEGKIYNRVHNYNYYHPDKVVETPMEARQKYLETGYIPTYIKNNDLK